MTGMSTRRKKQRMAAIGSAPPFDPLVNYANGEQGVYLAPWDINTLWQDDARTVPVESYGDPVRVMDDLSPNGNHAVAPTSTARGTYGRMPAGVGIRNLIRQTEDFSSSPWTPSHRSISVTQEGTRAGRPIWRVTRAATDAAFNLNQPVSVTDTCTVRLVARPMQNNITFAFIGSSNTLANFDLTAEEFVDGGIYTAPTEVHSITELEDGWWELVATWDSLGSAVQLNLQPDRTSTNNPVYCEYNLVQFEPGSEPTPYQRVGNQYDVSQEGVPDVYYIETDGIDDCYQTAPIDLTMYDSTSLVVGAQYLGPMTQGAAHIIELSENSNSAPGSYGLNKISGVAQYLAAGHAGTSRVFTSSTITGALDNNVYVHSISASISEPDLTSVLMGELYQNTGSQGSGNLGDYSLNLFSRGASLSFFQGRFFGAIIVHPRSPYEEQNRQFLAKKAGVTL